MNKHFWAWMLVGVLILLAIGWWAARAASFRSRLVGAGDRMVVGVTIYPLADMVKIIGGDHISVALLIPPGTTEHSSDLKPQVLAQLEQAKTLFAIGHGLDDKIISRVETAYHVPIKVVDSGIVLRQFGLDGVQDLAEGPDPDGDTHDSGVDPHYWLTIPNGIRIARTITDELALLDPAHADEYEANYMKYESELKQAEADMQSQAKGFSQRHFISMHNAWGYFANHYGLQLVATYEPIEGREPSLTQLKQLGEIVRTFTIKAFYAEPQKASTAATSLLHREFGLNILVLDPVGGVAKDDSYIMTMKRNMAALAAGQ